MCCSGRALGCGPRCDGVAVPLDLAFPLCGCPACPAACMAETPDVVDATNMPKVDNGVTSGHATATDATSVDR